MRHAQARYAASRQAELFERPDHRPRWLSLPPETRTTVLGLIARLLGDQRPPPAPPRPEVEHE